MQLFWWRHNKVASANNNNNFKGNFDLEQKGSVSLLK